MDTVTHVSDDDYQSACREADLRARFDRHPAVRAARKAYKQARVRNEPEAWAIADLIFKTVRLQLSRQLARKTY